MAVAAMGLALMWVGLARANGAESQPGREIPLEKVYATSAQKGTQRAVDGPVPIYDGPGPAVCAVAWGKDFKALKADGLILVPMAGDKPLAMKPPADGEAQLWAVVYFGTSGSLPAQWVVDSVRASKDSEFDIVYHAAKPGPMTKDLFTYVIWVPLGKPVAGKYVVRMSEGGKVTGENSWSVEGKGAQTAPDAKPKGAAAPACKAGEAKPGVGVKDGLSIAVSLEKATVESGKSIELKIGLGNVGAKNFAVYDPRSEDHWTMVCVGEDGKSYVNLRGREAGMTPGELAMLPGEGETLQRSVSVWQEEHSEGIAGSRAEVMALPPGKYQLRVTFKPVLPEKAVGTYWLGEVVAAPLALEITAKAAGH